MGVVKRFSEIPKEEIQTVYMPDAMLYLLKNGFVRLRFPGNMFATNATISNFRQALDSLNLKYIDKFHPGYPDYVEYMLVGFEDDRPNVDSPVVRSEPLGTPRHMPLDKVKTTCVNTNPGMNPDGSYIGADLPPYTSTSGNQSSYVQLDADNKIPAKLNSSVMSSDDEWHPSMGDAEKLRQLRFPL